MELVNMFSNGKQQFNLTGNALIAIADLSNFIISTQAKTYVGLTLFQSYNIFEQDLKHKPGKAMLGLS
jgi:hypothetical protein